MRQRKYKKLKKRCMIMPLLCLRSFISNNVHPREIFKPISIYRHKYEFLYGNWATGYFDFKMSV